MPKLQQFVSSLYRLVLLLITLILTACANLTQHSPSEQLSGEPHSETPTSTSTSQNAASKSLDWVNYADAKADANLAIAKQDFQFLAASNRTISLPGIDLQKYNLEELEQQCGYRFLAGMGDSVHSKNELKLRKRLHHYATEYNQLMLIACQGGTL
jgi:hypothetical protein